MVSTQGCAVLLASLAFALPGYAQRAAEMEMPSCVSGSPPMRVSSTIERAVLDAADSARFHEAAQARYPLYQRGGLVPAQVLMIRRGGHWQYVTLSPLGKRGGLCLSAVFAADRFDFTPGWLAKYEPRAGDPDD
jgi:hypothetical protein